MPKTHSAQKALRQNIKRRKKNIERKAKIKITTKQFLKFLKESKLEEAREYLKTVYKTVDKMQKVKLIKKGKANRMKSRLSKKLTGQDTQR